MPDYNSLLNPDLLDAARYLVEPDAPAPRGLLANLPEIKAAALAKAALVPSAAGGGGGDPAAAGGAPPGGPPPGGAPMPGGAPGMDPSMGGGAPPPPPGMDPNMAAQVAQVVQQMGGGGAGGAGGKAGGKKAEQQILSAQIRNLTFLVAKIAEKLQISVPPSMMVGPPNDPMTEQMAASELSQTPAVPSLGGDPSAAAGGAAPGGAPPQDPNAIPPMPGMEAGVKGAGIGYGIPASEVADRSAGTSAETMLRLLAACRGETACS